MASLLLMFINGALVMNIINCSAFTWTSWTEFLADLNGWFSFVKCSVNCQTLETVARV